MEYSLKLYFEEYATHERSNKSKRKGDRSKSLFLNDTIPCIFNCSDCENMTPFILVRLLLLPFLYHSFQLHAVAIHCNLNNALIRLRSSRNSKRMVRPTFSFVYRLILSRTTSCVEHSR